MVLPPTKKRLRSYTPGRAVLRPIRTTSDINVVDAVVNDQLHGRIGLRLGDLPKCHRAENSYRPRVVCAAETSCLHLFLQSINDSSLAVYRYTVRKSTGSAAWPPVAAACNPHRRGL